MATPDKIEAVEKTSQAMNKQGSMEQMEHLQTKEHFQNVMGTQPSALSRPSFERVDTRAFTAEEVQRVENQPAFGDDNVTSQKTGSATDEERKQRGRQETEEVEGVGATRSKGSKTAVSQSTSLMDEVSKLNKGVTNMSNMSPENVKVQAKEMISQLESVKSQLAQANTEIKPSYQTLLKNRLTHIDDNLKIALNKAGVEYKPAPIGGAESPNVINKFIGFLSNSQHQLETLDVAIDKQQTGGISPANMLAIQMKMGYVQQQIELFTSLLNKALESTKTIMNVQV